MTNTRKAAGELLSPVQEILWRPTVRLLTTLPSRLDADLVRGVGLTASEYAALANLSDAPNHELRMTDLAEATGLSASRTTRLVDCLQERGLLAKVASPADARSIRARIGSRGMAKLKLARQVHVEIVRNRFFDHIDSSSIRQLVNALSTVARQLEDSSRRAMK